MFDFYAFFSRRLPEDGTLVPKHVGNCYLSQIMFYSLHLLVDVMFGEMRSVTASQVVIKKDWPKVALEVYVWWRQSTDCLHNLSDALQLNAFLSPCDTMVKIPSITETIMLNKLNCFGHVERIGENRIPRKVLYIWIWKQQGWELDQEIDGKMKWGRIGRVVGGNGMERNGV